MFDFDLSGIKTCCCSVDCSRYPSTLYGSLDGPGCCTTCSVINYPVEMTNPTHLNPCYWEFSAGGGDAGLYCPDNNGAAFSITINGDGTVTISNPGGYCGPPDMTVTPTSLNPLLVEVTYDCCDGGINCCDEGECGSVTLTITE